MAQTQAYAVDFYTAQLPQNTLLYVLLFITIIQIEQCSVLVHVG